jgi:flagellin
MGLGKTLGAATTTLTADDAADTAGGGTLVNLRSARIYGEVSLTSSQGIITVNGTAGTLIDAGDTNVKSSLADLTISTASGATTALATIDAALDTINSGRGSLGAVQNRFESVVASQQVAAENLSASKSRIEDADFAAETAALTKAQILQQSGIAMLAQANAIPQNVLALLQ